MAMDFTFSSPNELFKIASHPPFILDSTHPHLGH